MTGAGELVPVCSMDHHTSATASAAGLAGAERPGSYGSSARADESGAIVSSAPTGRQGQSDAKP
jgi:hypothetical protein